MSTLTRIMSGAVLAVMFSGVFALPVEAAVVPCGKSTDTGVNAMCQTCHLVEAADSALRFVMFVAAPLVATILFIIAGFIRVAGATNTKSVSQSNTLFSNAIIGLVVIMLAWMVVNTFLKFVASNYFGANVKWYEPITCTPDENINLPPAPTNTVSVPPSSSVQAAAQRLLTQGGVTFSTSADCGAPNHARGNIDSLAAGQLPSVCSNRCAAGCTPGGASGTVTVDQRILDGLIALSQNGHQFVVSSLTTGSHSANSQHYRGTAVDITIPSGDSAKWRAARDFLALRGGYVICEAAGGAVVADCAVSQTNHIHWQLN
ncbi:MAG: hypothetical protein QY311_01885 [Candidatus Paceibacterota bacterium]|nr:MAG: hypothetical protein QY311_01885 [Candidatus Paceibacterota bacterium]